MANLVETLTPILLSMLVVVANSQKTYFSFDSFASKPNALTYQGAAHIPRNSSSALRLTKTDRNGFPQSHSVGRVLYSEPLQFWSPGKVLQFSTSIKFTITPVKGYEPADGLAFFIAPVGTTIPAGSSGGNLGVFQSSGTGAAVFAVEFDLYTNEWDLNTRGSHIGIDINSRFSSNVVSFDGSCLGREVELIIVHDGRMFTVILVCGGAGGSITLEYEYDLRSFLPQQVQVGLSASTGVAAAVHDINFWSFDSSMKRIPDSKTA